MISILSFPSSPEKNIPKSFHSSGKTYHWMLREKKKKKILCLNLIQLWFNGKCNFLLTRKEIKTAFVGYGVGRKCKEDKTDCCFGKLLFE